MTNYEVVKKILGETSPVGESNEDAKRFVNLENTCAVVQLLIDDIWKAHEAKSNYQASMKKIGNYAFERLAEIKESLIDLN